MLSIIGTLIGLGAVTLVDEGRHIPGVPLAVATFEIDIRASVLPCVLIPTLPFQDSTLRRIVALPGLVRLSRWPGAGRT